jgi:hypothetical protein
MTPKKTLQQREQELRTLLATPQGRREVEELAARYGAASKKLKPARTSAVTYVLVHERGQGLIE